ncbi:tail protein X [Escherichia coli]|uniref:tail protein X n=1 Tax=Escherichia coli TaxID=562 RepID=UPI002FE62BB0
MLRPRLNSAPDQNGYGRTQGVTEQVLKANPGLAEYGPFLPHGLQVELPDIPTTTTVQTVQLWD